MPREPRITRLGLLSLAIAALVAAAPARANSGTPPPDLSAAERQQRWRAAKTGRLQLPLPGTPDTDRPLTRLAAVGAELGAPIAIRIFKAESELEVWVARGSIYVPFATYPICYWSGTLGPKLREGDRQAPEGFYTLTERQLHRGSRWRRSLNIGYPNIFDRVNGRSGSAILIHGGCDSSGCFAMTDTVNAELYDLAAASFRSGTHSIPVHVFPFRMTQANIAARPAGQWSAFWNDLKQGYDSFERTRRPPSISVCDRRYRIRDASPFLPDAEDVELCEKDRDMVPAHLEAEARGAAGTARAQSAPPPCDTARASCRKWIALRDRRATSRTVAGQNGRHRSAIR